MENMVQEAVREILEVLGAQGRYGTRKELCGEAARRLSTAAGLENGKAWTWRYVFTVAAGTTAPGERFRRAALGLAASLIDEAPVSVAGAVEVGVLAHPGAGVRPGSVVLMASKRCGYTGCGVWIVSRGKYCCEEHRREARRERKRKGRTPCAPTEKEEGDGD